MNPAGGSVPTGIDKRPTDLAIAVRAPLEGAGSGLAGDAIGDHSVHGGDDQAVYAYAREDLDWWQGELGRDLDNGQFGENLTTRDVDVTGARIGEQWHIGTEGLVLEVSSPPDTLPHLRGLAESAGLGQDLYRQGDSGRISAGDLSRSGASG